MHPDTVEYPGGLYVWIRTNSIGQYSGYLSGYISRGQIRTSGIIEMDELVGGREFADFKSLSAAVTQFENSNFVQFYKRYSIGQSRKMSYCKN